VRNSQFPIFEKDGTNAAAVIEQQGKDGCPTKNVINDDSALEVGSIAQVVEAEEGTGIPFILNNPHHGSIKSGGRHQGECILL
jgi:hypothetical protein